MSAVELAQVSGLMFCIGFLYFKYRQRVLSRSEHTNPEAWNGKALDASELKQTLNQVRRDYLASRPRPKGI